MKVRGVAPSSLNAPAASSPDEAETRLEVAVDDAFEACTTTSLVRPVPATSSALGQLLGSSARVETRVELEERVGAWLQSLARGEVPTPAVLSALREQVIAHGALAMVVIDGWEQALAAELDPAARASFHSAVATFLGDRT